METNAYSKKPLSLAGIVILIIIVIIAAVLAWLYLRKAHDNTLSNAAVIGARIVNYAASVRVGFCQSMLARTRRSNRANCCLQLIQHPCV